ncbi:phage DNA encapsidation protein, partial [Herbiconiux daphne]
MNTKQTYYTPANIDKKNATYNIIFGERSNGKTYALLKKGIINFIKNKKHMAYVRRWKEDITGRRASAL